MSVVSEHPGVQGRPARVWHADESCSHFRKAEIAERNIPITSGNAGLPCSYCVELPPCDPPTLEDRLRRLVAERRPDVDYEAWRARLRERGEWSQPRIAQAIRRIDARLAQPGEQIPEAPGQGAGLPG